MSRCSIVRVVLLIGQQGTGKSTLGRELQRRLGGAFISGGELIRREIREQTDRGLLIAERIEEGERAPVAVVYAMLAEQLEQLQDADPLILDGFPGSIDDLPLLQATIGGPPACVLHLHGPPTEELVRRLQRRVQCVDCLAPFGGGVPAGVPGVCPSCNGPLQGRPEDDSDLKIARRHAFWRTNGPALIDYFEGRRLLSHIDARATPDDVVLQAQAALDGVESERVRCDEPDGLTH
jgi:adenylate kinase